MGWASVNSMPFRLFREAYGWQGMIRPKTVAFQAELNNQSELVAKDVRLLRKAKALAMTGLGCMLNQR